MFKVFISVPIHNRTIMEIWDDIAQAQIDIPKIFPGKDIMITHNVGCPTKNDGGRLYYLGAAVQQMDQVNAVYFCKGWESAKGCQVEHYICELYGVQRVEA